MPKPLYIIKEVPWDNFYYMTRDFRLSSVVIGMERLLAVKFSAEILEAAISKFQLVRLFDYFSFLFR